MNITPMAAIVLMMTMGARAQGGATTLDFLDHPDLIEALNTAWRQSFCGAAGIEATFRLDGSMSDYKIVAAPLTFEYRRQIVAIIPGKTFAVFHVHPQGGEPAPSPIDRQIADRYRLRIYTMHMSGLYEYDPVTRKTSRLREKLDWLKSGGPPASATSNPLSASSRSFIR